MNIQEIIRFKPLLTELESGKEPSIESMMLHYYTSHGISKAEAIEIVENYIAVVRKEFNI